MRSLPDPTTSPLPTPIMELDSSCCTTDSDMARTEMFHDEDEELASPPPMKTTPSIHLRLLFCLDGATLSLPMTALMYITNTRASIPLMYLSVYGAIAFLPASLKPMYAYLSDFYTDRHSLISSLLVLSGVSIASTALIPEDGVVACFLIAFLREVFSAWPEFLLGVTLLETAQSHADFDSAAALFQSQAATARNLGSLSANAVGFIFFLYQHVFETGHELQDSSVNLILVATGCLNLFGGLYAAWFKVGSQQVAYTQLETSTAGQQDAVPLETRTAPSTVCYDTSLIVGLQILVVLFALRGPFIEATSTSLWNTILFIVVMVLVMVFVLRSIHSKWHRPHRVGLFLIVRHSIPSAAWIMSSFVYSLFQSTPMILQLFGIIGSTVTTISSWSYGRFLAPYCSDKAFLSVIAGTTVVAAVLSFLNIAIVHLDSETQWKAFVVVVLISIVTTFFREWYFLPSVVLATTASNTEKTPTSDPPDVETPNGDYSESSYQHMHISCCESSAQQSSKSIVYATLVSCIDFGDQVGLWLTVPLVGALGVNREDWSHLGAFVAVTSLLQLIPLALLPIIRSSSK